MTIQAHGISRNRQPARPTVLTSRAPTLSGRPDIQSLRDDVRALGVAVAAMRTDLQALLAGLDAVNQRLTVTEDRLVRRVNEMLLSGTLAERPDAGVADRIYVAVDQAPGARLRFDDGTAWIQP